MELTLEAQVAILTGAIGFLSGAGLVWLKGWIDRREREERQKQEIEREILAKKLVRSATLEEIERYSRNGTFGLFLIFLALLLGINYYSGLSGVPCPGYSDICRILMVINPSFMLLIMRILLLPVSFLLFFALALTIRFGKK